MDPEAPRKCLCCKEVLAVDARHRADQKYCRKRWCRRASKAASQRAWLSRPENRDYFRGPEHVVRVQQWRAEHPGYWKRAGPKDTLQDTIAGAQPVGPKRDESGLDGVTRSDRQALWRQQSPLVIGLIAQLTGSTLQETIAQTTDRLFEKGQAVIGLQHENRKTNPESGKAAPLPRAV